MLRALSGLVWVLAVGCSDDPADDGDGGATRGEEGEGEGEEGEGEGEEDCTPGSSRCAGAVTAHQGIDVSLEVQVCDATGTWEAGAECSAGQTCWVEFGQCQTFPNHPGFAGEGEGEGEEGEGEEGEGEEGEGEEGGG